MTTSNKRSVTLRDIEEKLQHDLGLSLAPHDELLDRLIAVKQARALELIAQNLRDIRDSLQGNTYKS